MAFALAFSILARAYAMLGPVLLRVALPRAAAWCVGKDATREYSSAAHKTQETSQTSAKAKLDIAHRERWKTLAISHVDGHCPCKATANPLPLDPLDT